MPNDLPIQTVVADATLRRIFRIRRLEMALLRLYNRSHRLGILRLAPSHYSYPRGTRRLAVRHGVTFNLDISTYHGWMLYYHRSQNYRIGHCVSAGQVVIDIGANIGEVALICARRVGPTGRVLAFEPHPETFSQLKTNCALNPSLNCSIENLALGDRHGMVSMVQSDGRNPGTATVDSGTETVQTCATNVPLSTLDTCEAMHHLPRLDLLKLDVEGYEGRVIEGARDVLRRYRPKMVIELVDQHQRRHGYSARKLVARLNQLGYTVSKMSDGLQVTPQHDLDGCSMDVLCVPEP